MPLSSLPSAGYMRASSSSSAKNSGTPAVSATTPGASAVSGMWSKMCASSGFQPRSLRMRSRPDSLTRIAHPFAPNASRAWSVAQSITSATSAACASAPASSIMR